MAVDELGVNVTQEASTVDMPQIDRPCQAVTQSMCYLEYSDRDTLWKAPHTNSLTSFWKNEWKKPKSNNCLIKPRLRGSLHRCFSPFGYHVGIPFPSSIMQIGWQHCRWIDKSIRRLIASMMPP